MLVKATHYYPVNDFKEHIVTHQGCWCNPIVCMQTKEVIHICADAREFLPLNSQDYYPEDKVIPIVYQGSTSH